MKKEIRERIEKIGKGEVPEGYKKTKVGIIPKDWEEEKLGDIIIYKKGFAFKSEDYTSNGVRIIRVSDTTYDSIKEDNLLYIEKTQKETYSDYELLTNDLIVSTVGSKPPMYDSMVGKIIRIPAEFSGSLLNQNAVRLRPIKDHQLFMIFYQLRTKRYLNHIKKIFRGNANQANITLEDLFQFGLVFPNNPSECKKIDCIINYWDKAIELKEKLITEKKEFKRGLMQKLLTGGTRFPEFTDEWEEVKISKLLRESCILSKKPDLKRQISVKLHLNGVFLRELNGNEIDGATTLYVRHAGQFIYGKQNFHNGAFGIIPKQLDNCQTSSDIPTFDFKEEINPMYFFYYWSQKNKYLSLEAFTTGTGSKRLHPKIFLNMDVIIPNINEQNKIVEVINSVDKNIELLKSELTKLKEQKKGLMQLLLTGIVRVEVD